MNRNGVPRVALIGVSGYGRVHLQLARECRDRHEIVIVAATVINAGDESETIAELASHGTRIYADFAEMLQREEGAIDLCLIPTGIHWHARMTIAALHHGANVLVEKPLAGSYAETEAVRAAEKASGRFVAVGFQDLYDAGTVWLKQCLVEGRIGPLESIRFLGIWPRTRSYFQRNEWAGRRTVGGVAVNDSPLNNAFAHFVMLSQYFASPELAGAIVPELDHVELWRAHAIENFDTAVVAARSGGVRLWFGVSHACRETIEPEIVIQGRDGMAWWRFENEACFVDASGRQDRRQLPDTNAMRRRMFAAVLARLQHADAEICSTALAARHTALIDRIQQRAGVRDFPAELVSAVPFNGSTVLSVNGLTEALTRAFQEQRALEDAEFIVPIARPA